jgi:hypothetical protein
MAKGKISTRYEGTIVPLTTKEGRYMVVVEEGYTPPKVKWDDYDKAFQECLRLAKKENKKAYVVEIITQIELIPNVTQF